MYKNILQNIDNIALWPTISFVIFFLFFICLLWHVFTVDRSMIDKLSNMPFEENDQQKAKEQTSTPNLNIL